MVFPRGLHGLLRAADDDSELIVDLMTVLVYQFEGGGAALADFIAGRGLTIYGFVIQPTALLIA